MPDRGGYWLVASDGGVFSFGDVKFYSPIPGLGIAPDDWVSTFSGAVYAYGDAPYYGGASSLHLNGPIVAATGS